MGRVWNIVLSFDNEEWWEDGEDQPRDTCGPLERINQWIPDGKLVDLTKPTYSKGAGYGMDANLFGGGYKHFDIETFIEVVTQEWKERAKVQLWVKGSEEGMGERPSRSSSCGGGVRATQSPLRNRPGRPRRSSEPRRSDGCERSNLQMEPTRLTVCAIMA